MKTGNQVLLDTIRGFSPQLFDGKGKVVAVDRVRSKFASSYGADILTLIFDSNDKIKLFLKDFRNAPRSRCERETHVYQKYLSKSKLGTADCFGFVIDEPSERYWLFLEYVPGLAIKYRDFDYWVEGARWLGKMQSHFVNHTYVTKENTLLVKHNADFYKSIAQSAILAIKSANVSWTPRIEKIVESYSPVISEMISTPQTFTHGDFKPIQIIINEESDSLRVCPVDWEKCAFGSIYYDLSTLTEGFAADQLQN